MPKNRNTEIIEHHMQIYDELYDDHDKYFDYLYDFHKDIHNFINESSLLILNRDKFTDFFNFCVERINRPLVDQQIKREHATELMKELGMKSNKKFVAYQKPPRHSYYEEDDEFHSENETEHTINEYSLHENKSA